MIPNPIFQTSLLDIDSYFKQLKNSIVNKASKYPEISFFFLSKKDFMEKIHKTLKKSNNIASLSSSIILFNDPLFKSLSQLMTTLFKSNEIWTNSFTNPESFSETVLYLHFFLFVQKNFQLEITLPLNKFILFLHNSLIFTGVLNFLKEKPSTFLKNNEIFWDFMAMVLNIVAYKKEELIKVDLLIRSMLEDNRKYRRLLKKHENLQEKKIKSHRPLKVIIEKRLLDIFHMIFVENAVFFEEFDMKKISQFFANSLINSCIVILRKIFEEIDENKEFHNIEKLLYKTIAIIHAFSKKPEFFDKFILEETNQKTPLIKKVLIFFEKTLTKSEKKPFSENSLRNSVINLSQIFEIFTTGVLTGCLKEFEAFFIEFLIKLFDPNTIKTEIFSVLFDNEEPILYNTIKIVFNIIDKDLIISKIIPIIFFEKLEKNTQNTFKNFFSFIKNFSLSENQQNFTKILINLLMKKIELSQIIVTIEELLQILEELIFLLDKQKFEEISEELAFLLSDFLLKNNETFSKKEGKTDENIMKTYKKIFEDEKVFIKIIQSENFIRNFFNKAVNEINSRIFFVFLDKFFKFVLMETVIDPAFRNEFFSTLNEFLKKITVQGEEPDEFQEKILIFFCVFIETIIFQKHRFNTFEETFKNPDNSISLDVLFHEKVFFNIIFPSLMISMCFI